MKKIKHLILFLSLIFMFAAIPLQLKATHAAGLQLTYKHLSGSVYRITCTFFRDCIGIFPPLPIIIHASSSSCGIDGYIMLDYDSSQSQIITLTCPFALNTCNGGNTPGIEKIVCEIDTALPGQCSDWLFDIAVSARNNAITTLQNPGGDDIYVDAHLNNLIADNNSPQFTNDPIVFVCIGQEFHYNMGAYDADGDSLSYHMIAPRTDANIPCVYNAGYSVNNPCSSIPPVTFNDYTGDLIINSTAAEVAVLAFEVKDWRNGVLMGTVMRDIILFTYQCGNYPTATGMNGTSQQFLYVLPDDTVCFDILSNDMDVNDTVTMTWNQTIPNATFVTNGIPHPTGTFCWIPTINDVRSQPYMFTAMVKDNTCPLNNACIYSYFIFVTLDSSLVWAGINSPLYTKNFSVYPNPSSGIFELRSSEKIYEVRVFDSFGKWILKTKETRIDLKNFPGGIYFSEIKLENGSVIWNKILKE